MKMLSELLSELSARTKHTEEVATATREKNRDKLESMRAKLKTSVSDRNEKVKSSMGDVRSSVSEHFTSIRSKLLSRRQGA